MKMLSEDADETLLSQASQISDPEEEVGIWCDEKEIQNERRQALNDALGNLTSGRFSPILSTLNASWDDLSSTQQKYYTLKAREAECSYAVSHKSWVRKRPLEMYPKSTGTRVAHPKQSISTHTLGSLMS